MAGLVGAAWGNGGIEIVATFDISLLEEKSLARVYAVAGSDEGPGIDSERSKAGVESRWKA